MSLRVLMIRRNDASQVPGGDSLRFGHMQRHLADLGLSVRLCSEDTLPKDTELECDLVHLSNLQTEDETWRVFQWASQRSLPTVLSPIFWDMTDAYFELGLFQGYWQFVRDRVGRRTGLLLFRLWQNLNRPRQPGWRLCRRLVGHVSWLLPTSSVEIHHLRKHFWLPEDLGKRSTVVYSGIDRAQFARIQRPAGVVYERFGLRDYILEVGRISPAKNQLGLIEALWDVPTAIVFVGQDCPYNPEYAEKCRELASSRENVYFLGPLSQAELPAVYATAAVHVLPSWRETPGLASLEAAASGCRVVSTSLGCAREYLGDDAWYCEPNDLASIRSAVAAALQSECTDDLRMRILRDFTWERSAERTRDGYLEAISSTGTTRQTPLPVWNSA